MIVFEHNNKKRTVDNKRMIAFFQINFECMIKMTTHEVPERQMITFFRTMQRPLFYFLQRQNFLFESIILDSYSKNLMLIDT